MLGIVFTNLADISVTIDRDKYKVVKVFAQADLPKIEESLNTKTSKQRVLLVNGHFLLETINKDNLGKFKVILRDKPQLFFKNEIEVADGSCAESIGVWSRDRGILYAGRINQLLEKVTKGFSLKYT